MNIARARIALPLALAVSLCAPAWAQPATKTVKLSTAADGEVFYQFDAATNLPISAKDDRAEVVATALTFLPKKKGEPLRWAFHYGLSFKPGVVPTSIVVYSENKAPLVFELGDKAPKLVSGIWSASSKAKDVDKKTWDAMIGPDPWYLQRKIVVGYSDGHQRTLHQLAVITQLMRLELLEQATGQKLLGPAPGATPPAPPPAKPATPATRP